MSNRCDDLLEDLPTLVSGELDAERAESLRAHAGDCAPCARLVTVQTVLEHELRSLPAAPLGALTAPRLPVERSGTPRLLRWVAAAAAVGMLAVGVGMTIGFGDHAPERLIATRSTSVGTSQAGGERPVISKIVDLSGSGVASDDGLLALTAGLEAVAMRRPAKGR